MTDDSRVERAAAEFADYRYFEDDNGFDRDRIAAGFAASEAAAALRDIAERTDRAGTTTGVEGNDYVTGWNAAIGFALTMLRDQAAELDKEST